MCSLVRMEKWHPSCSPAIPKGGAYLAALLFTEAGTLAYTEQQLPTQPPAGCSQGLEAIKGLLDGCVA